MVNSSIDRKAQKAADALLSRRPMVVPGTRAIIEEDRAKIWHDEVAAKIEELKLTPEQVSTFCDRAGVAD